MSDKQPHNVEEFVALDNGIIVARDDNGALWKHNNGSWVCLNPDEDEDDEEEASPAYILTPATPEDPRTIQVRSDGGKYDQSAGLIAFILCLTALLGVLTYALYRSDYWPWRN
jgi:hypothetical protein